MQSSSDNWRIGCKIQLSINGGTVPLGVARAIAVTNPGGWHTCKLLEDSGGLLFAVFAKGGRLN
jgi:hypothetical protein